MSVELAEAALLNETQSYESKPEEQTACCSGDKSACGGDKSACGGDKSACACCSVGNDADDEAQVEEVAET